MVRWSRCSLVNTGICKIVFKTLNGSENTNVKRRVFGRCEPAQCRSQEAVFKSRISIDIQAKVLVLIRCSNQEFLKIESEPALLHLKEKRALFDLKFEVIRCMRNKDAE